MSSEGGIPYCCECNATEILRSCEQRICLRDVSKENREVAQAFDAKGVLPPADRRGATCLGRELRRCHRRARSPPVCSAPRQRRPAPRPPAVITLPGGARAERRGERQRFRARFPFAPCFGVFLLDARRDVAGVLTVSPVRSMCA